MVWKGSGTLSANPEYAKLTKKEMKIYLVKERPLLVSDRKYFGNLIAYSYYPKDIDSVLKKAKELRCASLRIVSEKNHKKIENYSSKQKFGTFVVKLTKNEEEQFRNLGKKFRNSTSKTLRQKNFDFVIDENFEFLDSFYQLYKQTCRVNKIQIESVEFIKNLLKSPYAKLFLSIEKNKKKIVAAAIVILDNDNQAMEYKWSAFSRDYKHLAPNNFLHWRIIRWGAHNGYEIYDLGGVEVESEDTKKQALYVFKKSFGGDLVLQHTFEIPIVRTKYTIYILVIRLRNLLDKLKKILSL